MQSIQMGSPATQATALRIIKSMRNPIILEKLGPAARVPATCPGEVLTKTES